MATEMVSKRAAIEADLAAVALEIEQLAPRQREGKKQPKRLPLPANLPRREIRHEPDSITCRCGCLFAADFVGFRFEVALLDLFFLQFQREAHFFARQFFGQHPVHAGAVVVRQIDPPDQHGLEPDAVFVEGGGSVNFSLLQAGRVCGVGSSGRLSP